ncbi:facilitated trehalose transporter Tret1-like [Contarinia nasturtii]|uniref:facilitated trehalose transporter Tret1-like n=1 Tax=Contarinia nasturtii TaxID=265458 RepID=UPI0012D450AD|nr:facilitated trehalose transporter Tret1-like [Contarinia nasturtii]
MGKEESNVNTFVPVTSVKFQYLAALVANLITIGFGVTNGWASPSLLLLKSDDSPLPSGKVTVEECSWIASLMCLGALVGNSFFGTISSKFGRKIGMLSLTLPTIIAWTLVIFAQNVYYLYASRAINGFVGGGVFVIIPVYLSEIASDRVRGALGSMLVLRG